MTTLAALVFPGFQTLDLFGPLEMFGDPKNDIEFSFVAETSEPISSRHGPRAVVDRTLSQGTEYDLILVPGGPGTPVEKPNEAINEWLIQAAGKATLVMGVCTGSALLGLTGLLDGRRATTCKEDFNWTKPFAPNVNWVPQARWVEDGKFWTSSGVSAGIDMSLAVIAHLRGAEEAKRIALEAEYDWHIDADWDPFAAQYGLV